MLKSRGVLSPSPLSLPRANTMLRQAQHERQKPNEGNARPVRPELVEG